MDNDKTRTPVQQRSIRTKKRIMDAALELFATRGYHFVDAKKIASHAGVSTGSFYAYFKDKKDLFVEVLKDYDTYINKQIELIMGIQISDGAGAAGFLRAMIQGILQAHRYNPGFHREVMSMQYTDTEIENILKDQEKHTLANVSENLKKHAGLLRVKDLETASLLVYNAIESAVHAITFSKENIEAERMIAELADMLKCYLIGS